jgi:hypothetical protein
VRWFPAEDLVALGEPSLDPISTTAGARKAIAVLKPPDLCLIEKTAAVPLLREGLQLRETKCAIASVSQAPIRSAVPKSHRQFALIPKARTGPHAQ